MTDLDNPWVFLLVGYLITVLIETPVLLVGLARRHAVGDRLLAGLWLTACTYPIVILVIPLWLHPGSQRWLYLAVAETFAPAAECLLFWLAFRAEPGGTRRSWARDFAAIVAANLASFAAGEVAYSLEWL